ncbi:actinia tenebrosa protease inhibitors-like [Tachypleus tridentatus]|uniref:actinia tenebrosa protease inhibitors-like n=1 Tax=Tachypleus tridentatus TaxID=6853 RepID=UPI003FD619C9
MRNIVLFCLFSLSLRAQADSCHLQPDSGKCLAYLPRFYFDPETETCEEFIYGGCGGNENNFETIEECLKTCKAKTANQVNDCHLEPETGPCKAYIPRFYFDKETGTCEQFIYGGCGGNANNFETKDECHAICKAGVKTLKQSNDCHLEPVTGPCKAYIPRFYFDKETGTCEQFIYGGCEGNANNFETKDECHAICKAGVKTLKQSNDCHLEPVTGPCKAYIPRFYFDKETGTCEQFIYGGCEGNANNFETKDECHAICKASVKTLGQSNDCHLEPETGPCKAYIPRFYFDKETGTCEQFIYGGCDGNANNFKSTDECHAICKGSRKILDGANDKSHCYLPPETGLCHGYFPSFFYDPVSKTCESFIYGGCGGNENRFLSKEKCLESCEGA